VNLYKEAGPWDTAYYSQLPNLILAEEDRACFYFFGVLYQLWNLGLYPTRPLFFDSWLSMWWRLWEKGYRPDSKVEERLIEKTKVDGAIYYIYHSPKFFKNYEQAKSKLGFGVRHDEST
jgi:hypothetical protein